MLDSQHPEGWQKMQTMEARTAYARLEVEELATGPPQFVTQLVVRKLLTHQNKKQLC